MAAPSPTESLFSMLRDSLLRIVPEPPRFEEPLYLLVRDPIGRHTIHSILILLRDTTALGIRLRDFVQPPRSSRGRHWGRLGLADGLASLGEQPLTTRWLRGGGPVGRDPARCPVSSPHLQPRVLFAHDLQLLT